MIELILLTILIVFFVSFIWISYPILMSKDKLLIMRTSLKTGYSEGVLLNLTLQDTSYPANVNISNNKLYVLMLNKKPAYAEILSVLPYEYSKKFKPESIHTLAIFRHAHLHSIVNRRNQP